MGMGVSEEEKKIELLEQKIDLFECAPVAKAVISMSVPTVLSSLVVVLYNLADTFFVGMLNQPVQNAAVTLAAPMMLAFNAITNLFGVGSSGMMSRCLGKKDYDGVRNSSAFGIYCTIFSGFLYSLLFWLMRQPLMILLGTSPETMEATASYLGWTVGVGAIPAVLNVVLANQVRAEGAALHASIGTMSGCILNILLDPVFILPRGLNLGVAGAGMATFLSNCIACLYFFVLLKWKREHTYVSFHPSRLKFSRRIIGEVCSVGVPASIQNLLNVTSMMVMNNFVSPYGPDAVAAMGIAHKAYLIPVNIAMGISHGIMPLVGYNFAADNRKRMRDIIFFAAKAAVCFLAVISIGYYIGAENLIGLFMKKKEIIAYGGRFLRALCIGEVFLCIDFLAVGVFQSCKMGRTGLMFALLRKVIMEIPALFILNRIWPLYGLPYALPLTELVLAAAAVICLRKLLKPEREGIQN